MNNPTIMDSPWKFGINDPSLIAWLILSAYFLTAILCWRARASELPAREPGMRVLWTVLSFLLFLLGLNKQLDIHQFLMEIGRELVAERAWQDCSPWLLGGIVAVMGALGVSALWLVTKFLRGSNRGLRWSYGVFLGLLGVHLLRFLPGPIAGLLVTHAFTEEDGLFHIHVIELLELGSLAAISFLARVSVSGNEEPTP